MCPFRNSVYRDREHFKNLAFKLITNETVKESCKQPESYEQTMEKNCEAIRKFFRENFYGKPKIKEDIHLANWRKWMQERKKMHSHLGVEQGRETAELAMNSGEDCRTEQEMKTLLECAQKIDPPGLCRSGPASRKTSSPKDARCICTPNQEKPEEVILNMEYVGVPAYIRRVEKDITETGNGASRRRQWVKSEYLHERTKELASKMKNIGAHYPETSLMVQGVAVDKLQAKGQERKSASLEEVPRMVFECVDDVVADLRRRNTHEVTGQLPPLEVSPGEAPPVAKLRVGDLLLWREVLREDKDALISARYFASGPLRCDLDFGACVGERATAVLRAENLGQTSVSLRWVQLRGPGPAEGGAGLRAQRFFHDKRDAECPPGQVLRHEVFFRSAQAGTFREEWELRFEPRLTAPGRRLLVRMWGVALPARDDDRTEAVLRHVERCVANAKAAEAVSEAAGPRLVCRPTPQPPYRSLYLEDEVFEHLNPGYRYSAAATLRLKRLYEEATHRPAAEWDLSLRALREAVRHPHDAAARQRLAAGVDEGLRLMATAIPAPEGVMRVGVRAAAYGVLCGFANAMEREALQLRNKFGFRPPTPPPPTRPSPIRTLTSVTSSLVSSSKSALEEDAGQAEECAKELYLQALYVCVYHLLGDAVERLVAAVSAPCLMRVASDRAPPPTKATCGAILRGGDF